VILAVDTHYTPACSCTAGVVFYAWDDRAPASTLTHTTEAAPEPYQPGAFYKRELPLILALLSQLQTTPTFIVIDGYVWLDTEGRRGLGAHLYEALGGAAAVIGVAKTAFKGGDFARSVLRGQSKRPLYVTTVGTPPETAAENIAAMHGKARMPTLLKLADRIARDGVD